MGLSLERHQRGTIIMRTLLFLILAVSFTAWGITEGWGPDGFTVEKNIEIVGSAKSVRKTAGGQTTDATPTNIYTETLAANEMALLEAECTARKSDGTEHGFYSRCGGIYREGGGATIQGSIASIFDQESDEAYDVDIVVSGNDFHVEVTGVAAHTVDWKCTIRVTKFE